MITVACFACGIALCDEDASVKPYGIAARVPWTTSKIVGSPEPPPPFRTARAFPNLQFSRPIALTRLPKSKRMVLVELDGRVVSFNDQDDTSDLHVLLDYKRDLAKFQRAYGFAFHPQFAKNRQVFLCYITDSSTEDGTRVSRFRMTDGDSPKIDPATEKVIIQWQSGGHNGGCLKFGPDGFLYITTGDGASPSPPDARNTGQDISDLLASVLRIDVDGVSDGQNYRVPADNPFVDRSDARPEVWAYGFRNPWKISFNSADGSLWAGDVGWEMFEMIYRVEKGGNYGWSVTEGPQPVRAEIKRGPTPILPPTVAHSHIESRSITGGVVYHGQKLPELAGHYIYGDYVTGKLWAYPADQGAAEPRPKELVDANYQVVAFGTDTRGEVLIVGYDGTLHRLEKNTATVANKDFPTKLSETGLFESTAKYRLAPGVIPYSLIAEPWADGDVAQRAIAIPGKGKLTVQEKQNIQQGMVKGDWNFPPGTVLMKTLTRRHNPKSEQRVRVETQLLHFDGDTWQAYAYQWMGPDAVLVPKEGRQIRMRHLSGRPGEPDTKVLSERTWQIASRTNCIVCHTTRAGSIHGFKPSQLDRPHDYGDVTDNQLRTLQHIGLFDEPDAELKKLGMTRKNMVNPHDESADINSRARSYLHLNCAHCHMRGGGGTAPFQLLRSLSMGKTGVLGLRPTQGAFGIYRAEVIAPEDPDRSVLVYRISTLGKGRMPHIGSSRVDEDGVRLIREWITQLPLSKDNPQPDNVIASQRVAQRGLIVRIVHGAKTGADIRGDLQTLLDSTSGALMLVGVMDAMLNSDEHKLVIARLAVEHPNDLVRGLFEKYIPSVERVARLGTVVDADSILKLIGNAARGQKLFAENKSTQCRNCHKSGSVGREVGPSFDGIGKRMKRPELLDSLLNPSKKIDEKYRAYVVETVKGRLHTGLLSQSSETKVTLRDGTGKEWRFDRKDIETLAPQRRSLMPDLLVRDMTAQQVADLLVYLESLK